MTGDWPETRREFQRMCAREGVTRMAADLPLGRSTIYRLLGETYEARPSVRAIVERVVEAAKQQQQGDDE